MSRITVRPGRARVTAKIWTNTMTIDSGPSYMSEEAAKVIWEIKVMDDLPWREEVAKVRTLMLDIMKAECEIDREALENELLAAQIVLSNKMAALALPVEGDAS